MFSSDQAVSNDNKRADELQRLEYEVTSHMTDALVVRDVVGFPTGTANRGKQSVGSQILNTHKATVW